MVGVGLCKAYLHSIVVALRRNVVRAGGGCYRSASAGDAIQEVVEAIERLIRAFAWVDGHKRLPNDRVTDRRVLDCVIEAPTIPTGVESESRRQLVVDYQARLILTIGINP